MTEFDRYPNPYNAETLAHGAAELRFYGNHLPTAADIREELARNEQSRRNAASLHSFVEAEIDMAFEDISEEAR